MIPGLKNMPYEKRLEHLGLWSLKERRNHADLLKIFKMYKGSSMLPFSHFFTSDVTIMESEIEIEFFLKYRIESKSIFWLVFVINFDSRLYWRRQRTAASSKNDS